MTNTQWNGEPCTATQVTVTVADNGFFPAYWAREFVGTRRKAVEVEYGDHTFYLDDEDGSGWDKVTHGGAPDWGHRDLAIEPGSVEPRAVAMPEFDYPRDPDAEEILNTLPTDVQQRIRARLAAEAAEGTEQSHEH
ncbi:hypothetical protein [Streptomyces cylindrosporus]|uniref:DUF317 domain-containing protein n=1 Tax=Streptomyces cylindrosporus TaxID=2927583 RepID=A0ABS9YJT6_9ACTN|nr:hypothetical protein [Streptomyces cylindrosporus]MCI3277488.1 hypothetical protein [Streptomyces cylindrosporus]